MNWAVLFVTTLWIAYIVITIGLLLTLKKYTGRYFFSDTWQSILMCLVVTVLGSIFIWVMMS